MINKEKCFERYLKNHSNNYPACPVCHKAIRSDNLENTEYVKTKRKTEIFIHTACVEKWAD